MGQGWWAAMSTHEPSDRIRNAVRHLFPDRAIEVVKALMDASGSERVQADILALSYGDFTALARLCDEARLDPRDVMIAEEYPEQFLGIASRPLAAVELARRFESLGFAVPGHTSYWARNANSG